jgi:transposase
MLKESDDTEPTEIDTLVFDVLVPPDHYLRRVKRLIDFEQLRDLITDCYSPAMGRMAEDPLRMIKLAFLQFHYNLSDREVMAAAQVHVAFRYVLDLSLASRLPVASVLAQCRTRLGAQRHQALFDQIVTQARAYGLIHDRL